MKLASTSKRAESVRVDRMKPFRILEIDLIKKKLFLDVDVRKVYICALHHGVQVELHFPTDSKLLP